MKNLAENYWLTDVTLSDASWCYIQGQTYKPATLLIRNMIDVWSKKGIVLLNVSPRADGVIPAEQRAVLKELGDWMERNGRAVYGTRPHSIFGYGTAEIHEGHFGGQSATIKYGPGDIRFTTSADKKHLFAFSLGQPDAGSELTIRHVFSDKTTKVASVTLVANGNTVDWSQVGENLLISVPENSATDPVATVFDITFE